MDTSKSPLQVQRNGVLRQGSCTWLSIVSHKTDVFDMYEREEVLGYLRYLSKTLAQPQHQQRSHTPTTCIVFFFCLCLVAKTVGRYKKVYLSSKTKSTHLDLLARVFIWDGHVRISIHFLQAVREICGEMGSDHIYIYVPKSSSKREDNDLDKV